ncbi:MAG: hypothetical protein [Microvirus sp.]|nr:MAG: hypothetical protein [Microvirus sp.]
MARRRRFNPIPQPHVVATRLVARHYPRVRTAMQLIEDRRVFHPEGRFRAPLSFSLPRRARLVVRNANFDKRVSGKTLPVQLGFSLPKRVIHCVRRKVRKEVIIAKGHSGSGSRKRRNYWSDISC